MRTLYSFFSSIAEKLLPIATWFSPKIKLFVSGRKQVFQLLKKKIDKNDKIIWFHAASLGEYEQGVPVMEAIKQKFPDYKILLTFFSPSGFEVKKNNSLTDYTVYLPLDTKKNAKKFLELTNPHMAVFIKYEIWPNYLAELKRKNIRTLLISGRFRKEQIFFKTYGKFMLDALKSFDHLFVQDEISKKLLDNIPIKNVTISGDTRFDRVSHQIEQNNQLEFMEVFKGENICVVCGSTWPEDENLLTEYINQAPDFVKFIVAPHEINTKHIKTFQDSLQKKSILYSEKTNKNLKEYQVLLVDTVGLLSKIYSYADVAYVGGAMGNSGLHNILEPATFGVPIVIGKNFEKFPEAKKLQKIAGLFSVANSVELNKILHKLTTDNDFRKKTGMIAGHFIQNNTGATTKIINIISSKL